MTYPIHPNLLLEQQKLGKLSKTVSLAEQRRPVQTSHWPFFNSSSSMDTWGNLIYGFLASNIPVEYELDTFNMPHTGTTLCHPQNWLCRCDALFRSRHLVLISPLGHFNGDDARLSLKSTKRTKLKVTPKFISSNGKQDFR